MKILKKFLKKVLCTFSPTFRKIATLQTALNHTNDQLINLASQNQENYKTINDSILRILEEIEKNKAQYFTKQDETRIRLNGINEKIAEITEQLDVSSIKNKKKIEPKISIICLIYKSTTFAKAVYESLHKYTPQLNNGEAELIFVANDADEKILEFLKDRKYTYAINNNIFLSEGELFKLGYGKTRIY